MKRLLKFAAALGLATSVAAALFFGGVALGQAKSPAGSPSTDVKAPVKGYTRMNKHTGQPERVRPYKRNPPPPKPVEVQPYTRQGRPVTGHLRKPPSGGAPGGKLGPQSGLPVSPGRDARRIA